MTIWRVACRALRWENFLLANWLLICFWSPVPFFGRQLATGIFWIFCFIPFKRSKFYFFLLLRGHSANYAPIFWLFLAFCFNFTLFSIFKLLKKATLHYPYHAMFCISMWWKLRILISMWQTLKTLLSMQDEKMPKFCTDTLYLNEFSAVTINNNHCRSTLNI